MMTQQRTLPDAIIQFSEAVEKMNKTILVPRRLMDLPQDSLLKLPSLQENGDCSRNDKSSGMEIPKEKKTLTGKETFETGLFGVYQMLLAMKDEVFTGRQSDVDGSFRNHVQAIVDTFKHMTFLAEQITNCYCEVCENGAVNGVLEFDKMKQAIDSNSLEMKTYREKKMKLV